MMPTINAASKPSRRPMTNVGSKRGLPWRLQVGLNSDLRGMKS